VRCDAMKRKGFEPFSHHLATAHAQNVVGGTSCLPSQSHATDISIVQ
jgi:hypothetical protein